MTPTGPKCERETVMVWDEDSSTATLWTASAVVYRRMMKIGWQPIQDDDRHALFEFPKAAVRLPRPRRKRKKE